MQSQQHQELESHLAQIRASFKKPTLEEFISDTAFDKGKHHSYFDIVDRAEVVNIVKREHTVRRRFRLLSVFTYTLEEKLKYCYGNIIGPEGVTFVNDQYAVVFLGQLQGTQYSVNGQYMAFASHNLLQVRNVPMQIDVQSGRLAVMTYVFQRST
jgi:hypothetical protein